MFVEQFAKKYKLDNFQKRNIRVAEQLNSIYIVRPGIFKDMWISMILRKDTLYELLIITEINRDSEKKSAQTVWSKITVSNNKRDDMLIIEDAITQTVNEYRRITDKILKGE